MREHAGRGAAFSRRGGRDDVLRRVTARAAIPSSFVAPFLLIALIKFKFYEIENF